MSTAEYRKEKYDNVSFKVPKGKRQEYQQAAADFGIAQSEMFRQAVEIFIAEKSLQDLPLNPAPMKTQKPENSLSSEQKKILDEFNQLSIETQKAFMKLFKTINSNK